MVPIKLALRNFMCYKNAVLDLEGVHIACLSGDNGAGKSALLDAITWSLWGKARASDDELIAQGEIEMQADFEFGVNEQLYRIIRTRTRKAAGHTELAFQVRTPEGGWRNIGGNTKRATQEEIIKVLRMEYETFINSAFLLQGRADEFTTRTPGERKKVLADILGLAYYDELETKAKEETKEADQRRRRLEERLTELGGELSRRPIYQEQKRQAGESLATSRATLDENEKQLAELQKRVDTLSLREQQRQDYLKRLREIREETAELSLQIRQTATDIENCRQIIARKDVIETGYKDWQDADRQHDLLMQKFHRYEKLITQRRDLENIIRDTERNLSGEQRSSELLLAKAQEQSRHLPNLEQEYAALEKELEAATKAAEQLEQKKNERQAADKELAGLVGENKHLSEQLKGIEKQAKQVPAAGEKCDRCGTVLDEAAREHTVEEFRKQYRDMQAVVKEKKRRIGELEEQIAVLNEQIAALEKPARRGGELQKQAGKLGENLKQARKAGEEAQGYTAKLEKLTRQLETKDFCQTERASLKQVEAEVKELGYDPETYKRVKERLNSLKGFEAEKRRLDDAQYSIVRLEEEAQSQGKRQNRLKTEEQHAQSQADELAVEIAALPELRQHRDQAQRNKETAQSQVEIYLRQLNEAEMQLKRCNELAVEKKRKEAEHTEAAQQQAVYKELSEAFGKKGLQALIIETILPELEDEANRLLGGMSDGRMSVRFDTQRDSKKGDAIETLDLRISDENGVRAYELFSGGEAFRVNFAVRVALSKLLARRSGAALRTLIIDEGFGSQDGAGRERMVEAIRSIEPEFERVLVITHIQELKDVFPVRIDVVKTPSGSQINVN